MKPHCPPTCDECDSRQYSDSDKTLVIPELGRRNCEWISENEEHCGEEGVAETLAVKLASTAAKEYFS